MASILASRMDPSMASVVGPSLADWAHDFAMVLLSNKLSMFTLLQMASLGSSSILPRTRCGCSRRGCTTYASGLESLGP